MEAEGIPVDVVVPPKPRSYSLQQLWLFLLGFAAIRKAEAERTRYRGYQPLGQGRRAYARAHGYENYSHMQRVLKQQRDWQTQVEQERRDAVDAAAKAQAAPTTTQ